MFPKVLLHYLDHDLPAWTIGAETVQDGALCTLCQPPLGPKHCCQLLAQPGQHGIQEVLSPLEKSCPVFEQEAAHRLCPLSSLLSWGWCALWRGQRGCHGVMGPDVSEVDGSFDCRVDGIL